MDAPIRRLGSQNLAEVKTNPRKPVCFIIASAKVLQTLAEAMMKQTGFSRMYCNLVKAGEAGGVLFTMASALSVHGCTDKALAIVNKVTG